ncbi:hypothetical protein HNQ91_000021 [Filimonas zeae]|nr:hypothetical protein [Filimonas zeae]MDR6336999.1 hypothetical protein [Filimonas zeae]
MIERDNKLIFHSFAFLISSDAIEYLSGSSRLGFNSTYICAILKLASVWNILKIISNSNWKKEIPAASNQIFSLMLLWNLITFFRGAFFARDYWDWKYLMMTASFSFLIPYALILGIRFYSCVQLFRFIIKKLYWFGFVLVPLSTVTFGVALYARMMFSVSLFLMFSVYMKRKWFYVVGAVGLLSILSGYDLRANIMRVFISFILIGVYYFKNFIGKAILRFICLVFFVVPLVFLALGFTGQFNIFKLMGDDEQVANLSENEANLTADTRTLLYEEVYRSMDKHQSLIWGEGAASKYESSTFDYLNDGRGRYGAEVGFLNTLLSSGIVGVGLYFMVLFVACYYGINHSKNFLCKMLSVFLAGRWVVFFAEDITKYDMNYYFLWLAVGLCFSNRFRKISDREIRAFFLLIVKNISLKKAEYIAYLRLGR